MLAVVCSPACRRADSPGAVTTVYQLRSVCRRRRGAICRPDDLYNYSLPYGIGRRAASPAGGAIRPRPGAKASLAAGGSGLQEERRPASSRGRELGRRCSSGQAAVCLRAGRTQRATAAAICRPASSPRTMPGSTPSAPRPSMETAGARRPRGLSTGMVCGVTSRSKAQR
jgi:hypothetical protein